MSKSKCLSGLATKDSTLLYLDSLYRSLSCWLNPVAFHFSDSKLFASFLNLYVPLDGLRTAAWVQLCRLLNKNISIITTPFSKFPLIRF